MSDLPLHSFTSPHFHCGTVAIVGRPNVGKSTLMNRLVGAKVSITSRKAQTTRHRIAGIQTKEDAQFIYVDTPGFQTKHTNLLNRHLNRTVTATLSTVDVVLYVIEAGVFSENDRIVLALLSKKTPCILVLNKVDTVKQKTTLMPFIAEVAHQFPFVATVPVSAKQSFQLDRLEAEIKQYLPVQDAFFASDMITDKNERFLASEIVREKVFRYLGDELPYTSTVLVEKFEPEGQLRRIFIAILVDREPHKAMVIGKKGARLKQIATEARLDMEKLFGGPVYLETWVKIKSGWADTEAHLRSYGYE